MLTRKKLIEWLSVTPEARESLEARFVCNDGRQYFASLGFVLGITECFDVYIWSVISNGLFVTALPINLPESFDIASEVFTNVTDPSYCPEGDAAEFCARYCIHPLVPIFEDEFAEPVPEPVQLVLQAEALAAETFIQYDGFVYRRRTSDRHGGYYYSCVHGCDASVHFRADGTVEPRHGDVHQCIPESSIVSIGRDQWRDFLDNLGSRLDARGEREPLDIMLEMAEENPEWKMIVEEFSYSEIKEFSGDSITGENSRILSASPFDDYGPSMDFVKVHNVGQHPIIIMASEFMLSIAKDVGWILIDGTFKCAPRQFQQILNIVAEHPSKGIYIPIAHILLADKMQETYEMAFDLLLSLVRFPNLRLVTCDFEKGLRNAIRKWLDWQNLRGAVLRGCIFHFTQSLVRYVRTKYGKMTDDREHFLRVCYSFIYMDRPTVESWLDQLSFRNHGMNEFLVYFRREWMTKFEEWNLQGHNDYVIRRATNNAIESFNKQLNDLFCRNSPRIEKLIDALRGIHDRKRIEVEVAPARDELPFHAPLYEEIACNFSDLAGKYDLLPEFAVAYQTQESIDD